MSASREPITIRPAGPGDLEAVADIHVRTWQTAYRGMLPDELLDRLSVADLKAEWRQILDGGEFPLWISAAGERITGFINFGPCHDDDASADDGEVVAIYVDPEVWSRGHGTLLLDAALRELTASGCHAVKLWVLSSNLRTVAFYEARGFQSDGKRREVDRSGNAVREKRMVRTL